MSWWLPKKKGAFLIWCCMMHYRLNRVRTAYLFYSLHLVEVDRIYSWDIHVSFPLYSMYICGKDTCTFLISKLNLLISSVNNSPFLGPLMALRKNRSLVSLFYPVHYHWNINLSGMNFILSGCISWKCKSIKNALWFSKGTLAPTLVRGKGKLLFWINLTGVPASEGGPQ